MRSLRLLSIATLLAVLLGCFAWCTRSPEKTKKEDRGESVSSKGGEQIKDASLLQVVTFDHSRPEKLPRARVEVLVDSSASMAGFRKSLPRLLHAVDQALSYSRDVYFAVESKKTCFFKQDAGIFDCQSGVDGVPIASAAGYTNLDKAIDATADTDLAIIFTDGVPAGRSSGQACVGSGVDAACVADALSRAIRGAPGTIRGRARGVWLVSILTMHEGLYFTEQPIPVREFDGKDAEEQVRKDMDFVARVQNPRAGSDGNLLFDYVGPRYLLAIVIGDLEVGRPFLQEFFNHTEFSSIGVIHDAKKYVGGTTSLVRPAVEVFPSNIPPQVYSECRQERNERGQIIGDLVGCVPTSQTSQNQFRLSCRPKPSKGSLIVSPTPAPDSLRLGLLAPFTMSLAKKGQVSSIGFANAQESLELRLEMNCDAKHPVGCGSTAGLVELTSTGDLAAAASAIADEKSPANHYLGVISTRTPAVEPHKVYGLADLLQNFYRRKLPEAQSRFAMLEFCQE